MQRMNEMLRKMPLTPILCVLLLLSCQSNSQITDSTSVVPSQSAATQQTTSLDGSSVGSTVSSQAPPDSVSTVNSESTATTQLTGNLGMAVSVSTGLTSIIMVSGDSAKPATSQPPADILSTVSTPQDTEKSQTTDYHLNAVSTVASEREKHGNVRVIPGEEVAYKTPEESSQGASVFWGLLVTGLLLAAALIGGHVWKNHRCSKGKGMALAEESCVADEENQGNTLVSVAPLNPPESQEKPSQNGESLESVKTQNPPTTTNGHSATKADTEL